MLQPGDQLPDATVMNLDRQPVALRSLAAEGPVLLVFYLFDWSAT